MTHSSGMTGSLDPSGDAAMRLRAVETGLAAAGLSTRLHESPAGSDLTATLRWRGLRDIEVVIDDDGYTELRYWASLEEPPTRTVTTITSALSVIIAGEIPAVDPAPQPSVGVAGYDGAVTQRAGESGMSGPEDRVATPERPDHARPPEADHPREAHAQHSDLRSRLEQLPEGHPSSPTRDDGTRKSPSSDLSKYELPLPDEPRSASDQPDQDLAAEDRPRVNPDGSWQWKDGRLTPEESRAADQALAHCHDSEGRDAQGNYGDHGLTPAMRRIETQLDHAHLVEDTEKYALKEPDRFKEKLAAHLADEPDSDLAEVLSRINDGVRYTFVFEEEHYSLDILETCSMLASAGFELFELKNAWIDTTKAYQGINSTWMDHGCQQLFEVQVHTPASWRAKQESHDAYEVAGSSSSTPEQRLEATKLQESIFSEVAIPPGVGEISPYLKEGWRPL